MFSGLPPKVKWQPSIPVAVKDEMHNKSEFQYFSTRSGLYIYDRGIFSSKRFKMFFP